MTNTLSIHTNPDGSRPRLPFVSSTSPSEQQACDYQPADIFASGSVAGARPKSYRTVAGMLAPTISSALFGLWL